MSGVTRTRGEARVNVAVGALHSHQAKADLVLFIPDESATSGTGVNTKSSLFVLGWVGTHVTPTFSQFETHSVTPGLPRVSH